MLHRVARLLLVGTLVSSGASAPFVHVHVHGRDHGTSPSTGGEIDAHCAHHRSAGAHWHPTGRQAAGAAGARAAAGDRHRHAAVAPTAAAVETPSVRVAAAPALIEAPEAGVVPSPRGGRAPVGAIVGPDPPPRAVLAARAPPVRS